MALNLGNYFSDKTLKPQAIKKNKQVGQNQPKIFCTSKGEINSVKKQPTKWKEIFLTIHPIGLPQWFGW